MKGSGEKVCYIINDLLNRELIKQNFRFNQPVIPDDEELEESKEDDIGYDIDTADQLIDGSKQTLRQYFKQCDALGKFLSLGYDSNFCLGYEEQINKNEHIETAFDDEDNEMIEPTVDPQEWYREYERVIQYIDKEIYPSAHSKSGSPQKTNGKSQDLNLSATGGSLYDTRKSIPKKLVEMSAADEGIERIGKIIEYFNTIKEFMTGQGKKELNNLIENIDSANVKILKYEK